MVQRVPVSASAVNLLLHSPAQITLSSRVDNPRDFPEHIVDGKAATAWNGKTGDVNAWIEVKLDSRVQVTRIAITAGFDKGALFTQNLRIATLRIERDGVLVKDAKLDTARRDLQSIEVNQPGGTYKLTVRETVPGTNAAWREIVVSELQVWGTAPRELLSAEPQFPVMKVAPGSAAAPVRANLWEVPFAGREGANATALCTAWRAEIATTVKHMQTHQMGLDGYNMREVKCVPTTAPTVEGTLPFGWTVTGAVALDYFDGVAGKSDQFLVLKRSDGVTVGGPLYSTHNDIGDSGAPLATRIKVVEPASANLLVLSTVEISPYLHSGLAGEDTNATAEHWGRTCRFEPTRFRCDAHPTEFRKVELTPAVRDAFVKHPVAALPSVLPDGGIVNEF